jgi:small subunit ribosomal protein S2
VPAPTTTGAPVATGHPDEKHVVAMRDLLQGGVHFGHQTRRWNPKMKPYIFAERGGIYIIDLMKTTELLDEAYAFVRDTVSRGGTVLFVGTKKQCQESIKEQAERVAMPYVSNRWLGGLLTNFSTITRRIRALHEMRENLADGTIDKMPAREAIRAKGELAKLENNLGGVSVMERLPAAVFVIDPRKEQIVVREAHKLGIPLIGLVDTNCDPDEMDYVIPGNDDAIRSCSLISRVIADAVQDGKQLVSERELRTPAEAMAETAVAPEAAPAEAPARGERPRGERGERGGPRGRGGGPGGPGGRGGGPGGRGGGPGGRGGGPGGRGGGPGGQRPLVNLGEAPTGRVPRSAKAGTRPNKPEETKPETAVEETDVTPVEAEATETAAAAVEAPEAKAPEAEVAEPKTEAKPEVAEAKTQAEPEVAEAKAEAEPEGKAEDIKDDNAAPAVAEADGADKTEE